MIAKHEWKQLVIDVCFAKMGKGFVARKIHYMQQSHLVRGQGFPSAPHWLELLIINLVKLVATWHLPSLVNLRYSASIQNREHRPEPTLWQLDVSHAAKNRGANGKCGARDTCIHRLCISTADRTHGPHDGPAAAGALPVLPRQGTACIRTPVTRLPPARLTSWAHKSLGVWFQL